MKAKTMTTEIPIQWKFIWMLIWSKLTNKKKFTIIFNNPEITINDSESL